MPSLMKFIVAQTQVIAEKFSRANELVSGVVVRVDGAQVIVNIGDSSIAAQPTLAQPVLRGDRVWVQYGVGQPKLVGIQSRDSEVTSG